LFKDSVNVETKSLGKTTTLMPMVKPPIIK